jgi:predicted P-loop ATPase
MSHKLTKKADGKPPPPKGQIVNFDAFASSQAPPDENPVNWLDLCEHSNGRPLTNLANVMIALRMDTALKDAFAWDEMKLMTIVKGPIPGASPSDPGSLPREISDVDVTKVQEYLQTSGLSRVGTDVVHQAIGLRADECREHPVRRYLDGLIWDGNLRVEDWLQNYLGAQSTLYTRGVGRMFLVSTVARIFEPGCKCDHTLVLEGPQGCGKTTVCRVLGVSWFSDSLPENIGSKDAVQHLAGKWIVELSELAALTRSETSSMKSFLTRSEDRYRPPYTRKEIMQRRQCVFIGTTNQSVYLIDDTGGRRFWPVALSKIDINALVKDRDQLFAEAVALFKQGERWYPDKQFENEHIRPEQEARFLADSWEEPIRAFLLSEKRVRVGDVLSGALQIDTALRSARNERRVTNIMQRLGWRRDTKKDADGNISWVPHVIA